MWVDSFQALRSESERLKFPSSVAVFLSPGGRTHQVTENRFTGQPSVTKDGFQAWKPNKVTNSSRPIVFRSYRTIFRNCTSQIGSNERDFRPVLHQHGCLDTNKAGNTSCFPPFSYARLVSVRILSVLTGVIFRVSLWFREFLSKVCCRWCSFNLRLCGGSVLQSVQYCFRFNSSCGLL